MSCEKQFVFYAAIVSFELELGGPRWKKNSDLELVGGRDNRYNNERNKRVFQSAAVSKGGRVKGVNQG